MFVPYNILRSAVTGAKIGGMGGAFFGGLAGGPIGAVNVGVRGAMHGAVAGATGAAVQKGLRALSYHTTGHDLRGVASKIGGGAAVLATVGSSRILSHSGAALNTVNELRNKGIQISSRHAAQFAVQSVGRGLAQDARTAIKAAPGYIGGMAGMTAGMRVAATGLQAVGGRAATGTVMGLVGVGLPAGLIGAQVGTHLAVHLARAGTRAVKAGVKTGSAREGLRAGGASLRRSAISDVVHTRRAIRKSKERAGAMVNYVRNGQMFQRKNSHYGKTLALPPPKTA